jgi:hypothetical protein
VMLPTRTGLGCRRPWRKGRVLRGVPRSIHKSSSPREQIARRKDRAAAGQTRNSHRTACRSDWLCCTRDRFGMLRPWCRHHTIATHRVEPSRVSRGPTHAGRHDTPEMFRPSCTSAPPLKPQPWPIQIWKACRRMRRQARLGLMPKTVWRILPEAVEKPGASP